MSNAQPATLFEGWRELGADWPLLGVHQLYRGDHDRLFRHTGHTHTQMCIRKFYAFHCVEAVDNASKDGVAGFVRLGVEEGVVDDVDVELGVCGVWIIRCVPRQR